MFKRSIVLFLSLLLLCSCNPLDTSDYQGYVEEIKEKSIVIAPPATDPEAQYPTYEIFITEETFIEGSKDSIDELERLDNVKVWIDNESTGKEFAEKIVVED